MVNVTNWSQMTDFDAMLQSANSNSPFWTSIMFFITLVILVITSVFGIEVALLTSSFIGFIIGFLLAYMGLVGWGWVLMLLGVLVSTLLYVIIFGKGFE